MRTSFVAHPTRALAILLLAGLTMRTASAQTTYGQIVGNVKDATEAMMVGVRVTVINQGTHETYTQATNDTGAYAFRTLIPGTYLVRGEMAGFRPVEVEGIVLQVNQTARFDLTLEVGQVADRISVTASAPVLAQDTTDIGQVINTRQIVDLPLNGRSYVQLAALTNGVLLTGTTESGGPNFLSDGGRPTQNSFLVDGVETRIQREGNYGLNLSVDAIDEFKVMQNSFSAEYGRATTIVNAAIRSGGNAIHGTLFEFLRNDFFDARNAFDLTGTKPPLRQNQFGGSVGGPIKRDKLFYFLNYEGQRIHRGTTQFTNVPTAAMFGGDLSGLGPVKDPLTGMPFPNNQIPSTQISQFASAAKTYYPAPTGSPLAGYNYGIVLSNPQDMNQGTARIDYLLSSKDRISGHFIDFRYNNISSDALPFHGYAVHTAVKNVAVEHTHVFSPNLLNNLRFGYSNSDTFNGPDRILSHNVTADFGLKNLTPEAVAYDPPEININGFGSIGSGAWIPNGATDTNRQIVEQLNYTKGRHSMKFGTDLRFYEYDDLGYAIQNGSIYFNGQYSGQPVADFLLGIPASAFAHQAGGKGFTFYTSNGEFSYYFQDDIKVSRALTVNAGLRYEDVRYPVERNNEFDVWNFQQDRLDFAGKNGVPRSIVNPKHNNWAPRLGLAYSPSFLKRTVIRAAGAMTYGNYRQWEVSLFHFSPPYVYEHFLFNDAGKPAFNTSTIFPAPQPLNQLDYHSVSLAYQSPDKRLPRTYQWNFNIQHELMPNLLLEVGYLGNRSDHQPNRYDANGAVPDVDPLNPTPIQSRRPYQDVGFVSANTSLAWSNYNALNVRVERRFDHGLSLLGTYTWSKAMGIRGWDNWTVMDINNIRLNYGPQNDYTHQAVISYIYDLPFGKGKQLLNNAPTPANYLVGGWQFNGITAFRSGGAFNVVSGVSSNLGNRAGNRPNRIKDGNLPTDQRTRDRWFDTSAFVDPVTGRYGNSGDGVLRGPGLVNWDMSLFKNNRIGERMNLQFRWELFNAFNRVNLYDPSTCTCDARFGAISGAQPGREMQLGLKLLF